MSCIAAGVGGTKGEETAVMFYINTYKDVSRCIYSSSSKIFMHLINILEIDNFGGLVSDFNGELVAVRRRDLDKWNPFQASWDCSIKLRCLSCENGLSTLESLDLLCVDKHKLHPVKKIKIKNFKEVLLGIVLQQYCLYKMFTKEQSTVMKIWDFTPINNW